MHGFETDPSLYRLKHDALICVYRQKCFCYNFLSRKGLNVWCQEDWTNYLPKKNLMD